MFELPDSTLFNRRIPKLKFYQRAAITTQLKRVFTEQISLILWQNKLAPSTLNVAAGQTVTEIQVIRIKLNQRSLDADALALIEKEIPYHLLFLLEYADAVQAWISYKDETGALKSGVTYHTEWIPEEALPLKLDGLSMDALYENFVRQVAGSQLMAAPDAPLADVVVQTERRKKLLKEIAALEKKVRNEKQFNRQVELNRELKRLKKELDE